MLILCDFFDMVIGWCYYILMVDEIGGMFNDLVIIKLVDDKFWVLVVDSDFFFWIKGLVYVFCLEVDVDELDVLFLVI